MVKNILTIAGTDPSGGAGIQADIKTFSALGTYAMSVITAVVAQNTQGVRSYRTMDAEFVGEQIDAVFDDIAVDAVKIGMLANADIVKVVASKLKQYNVKNVVLDPVMVAKSGDPLIDETAVAAIRDILLPQVTIVTPNIPEACVLLNKKEPISLDEMEVEAKNILQLNPRWVLLKGGHLTGNICRDVLCNSQETYEFVGERIITKNDHGTGCTLSSAITALLPTMTVPKAVEKAKAFLEQALQSSHQLSVGHGHGPLHHFCNLWK
ncbi:Hydroxymethylpyrimidine/phosphomethylpyrimidine kinase (ThiD) (PDB:1Y9X) (PUBMED:17351295) [Commensalibacter communis]|uniref:hydroxymethylpyrimidine kinase n=1 Tax=Commensalibacter communis TaxID=2972786 RepID=A0A9W4TLQ1_9PROT|nr:bifunctional hydroxymethylpyrimidine kinase/phosphomethylpyrimidine kinase [Commensalibacter communis]CAI3925845.1 Hydroxymethylpyrimidine/phosphomethylpyrimidine kinase (ThiD) (PDB:1Y9X) (PUBMED:17351295) [Commensalibacter communis]CAI3926382.1 Hydroxymethylpyrimidine/phosphomethylpyrimidine kinase (ThiD) (PDB:1Y9X) (PUBMED:17351295) [Commensalibacter communis]CAI3934990.1 Hydroxymethylpyrimidine/phosphomethylpyrimidine kinase (ThiD) (PDB:1Y9X) (PUBMED:17351295) [Commensalibacter communis]C